MLAAKCIIVCVYGSATSCFLTLLLYTPYASLVKTKKKKKRTIQNKGNTLDVLYNKQLNYIALYL